MTFCPYNPAKICDEGFIKTRQEGFLCDEHRCGAWISAAGISDICSSRACAIVGPVNGTWHNVLPCEIDRCPYQGCGRHTTIERVPDKVMVAAAEFQIQAQEKKVTS